MLRRRNGNPFFVFAAMLNCGSATNTLGECHLDY